MAQPWRPSGYETPEWQALYGEKRKKEREGRLPRGQRPLGQGALPKPAGWSPEMKAQQRQQYVGQRQALARQATALQEGGTNAMVIGGQLVSWPRGGTPPPMAQWQHQAQWDIGQRQGQQVGGGVGPYPQLAGTPRPQQQQFPGAGLAPQAPTRLGAQQAPQMSMMLQQPWMPPPVAQLPQQAPQTGQRRFVTTPPPTQLPQPQQKPQQPFITPQPSPQPMPMPMPMSAPGVQLTPQVNPQAMYQSGYMPGTQLPQNALLAELLRLGY